MAPDPRNSERVSPIVLFHCGLALVWLASTFTHGRRVWHHLYNVFVRSGWSKHINTMHLHRLVWLARSSLVNVEGASCPIVPPVFTRDGLASQTITQVNMILCNKPDCSKGKYRLEEICHCRMFGQGERMTGL